jgi:drug/metabolite transporter (DMT)-like permease
MSEPFIGVLFTIAATFSWAAGSICLRFGIDGVRILPATAISLVSGFFYVLFINLIIDYQALFHISLFTFIGFSLIGITQFLGGRALYYTGVSLIGVGRATALGGGGPIVSSLLAVVLLGEIVTMPLAIGIAAVVVGVLVIVLENSKTMDMPSRIVTFKLLSQARLGFVVIMASTLVYSVAQVSTRSMLIEDISPIIASLITLFAGSIVLLLLTLRDFKDTFWMIIAGILASNGAMLSFLALQKAPVVLVSPILSITPLITLVLAAIFLRQVEKLNARIIIGSLIVVVGVVLVVLAK